VGKTTVIRAVAERLEGLGRAGFYTEEIREGGQRSGFRIVTLDGRQGTLASVGSRKPTVGRYTVHVEEFEKLVLPSLEPVTQADLYVIDEIGKMELRSAQFRARIMALLQQPTNLLASASKKADGLIDRIRRRRDVEVIEVTRQNRDALAEQLVKRIKTALGK
jgi:nucleoside-triphosphatase